MERKTAIADIHKNIPEDLPILYGRLSKRLGSSNPFARIRISMEEYVWNDSRYPWQKMTDATPEQQDTIRRAVCAAKERVTSIFGAKDADLLFLTPNDTYIYYYDDNGDMKILLTGWGFRMPPKPKSGVDRQHINTKNPIIISFEYDGVAMANYTFGLAQAHRIADLQTGGNGEYIFPDLKVGTQYTLYNKEHTHTFALTIIEGQSHYQFDITQYSTLHISATIDDQPICDENIQILYNGGEYEIVTDSNGEAIKELPYHPNENITVVMCEQRQSTIILEEETYIHLSFHTPQTPTPEAPKQKIKIMFRNLKGGSIICDNVTFKQQDKQDYTTELINGNTNFEEEQFAVGVPIETCIYSCDNSEQYAPFSFSLEEEEYEYLLQELKPKTNWQMIILNCLAIFATVVLLSFLWQYLEILLNKTNNLIYQ